jgi:uncharacterized protein (TIGR00369 family)
MKPLQPADADFAQRVATSFARQPAMATLGATLGEVGAGRVETLLTHRADLTQQHGFLHAGIVATVLDSACGYAAYSLMPADAAVLTIEFKINLLAPARGPHFRFVGQVVKAGHTISVVDGQAFQGAVPGQESSLFATMTATTMTLLDRGLNG